MGELFARYQKFLRRRPVLTQAIQTGLLMAIGDVIAQTLVEETKVKNVNLRRTAEFASVGFFFAGPVLQNWFTFLDTYIAKKKRSPIISVKKMVADQFGFIPIFLGCLLFTLGTIQTKDPVKAKEKVKRDYVDILLTSYKLWPAVQLINFNFVPLNYQVLVVQTVCIFWNTYLSWKTQKPNKKEE